MTVEDSTRLAQEIVQSNGCHSFVSATTEEQMQSLWSARKQALWASLAARPEGTQIWSTDVAVPLSRMAELIGTQMHTSPSVWTNTWQRYPRRELAI